MPELPEVEGFASVARRSIGATIRRIAVRDRALLKGTSPARFERSIENHRIRAVSRHGKHLFLEIAGAGAIEMHFGMNGSLALVPHGDDPPPHTRLVLDLGRGKSLAYVNPRRFGHFSLTPGKAAFVANERLGPDALDPRFDRARFETLLARKRDIKGVLMDQHLVAGIGNIWADEILFQARIHPATPAAALGAAARTGLFRALKRTLQRSITIDLARPPRPFLLGERTSGGHCPHCGGALATLRQRARTTYYCPACQRRPARGQAA